MLTVGLAKLIVIIQFLFNLRVIRNLTSIGKLDEHIKVYFKNFCIPPRVFSFFPKTHLLINKVVILIIMAVYISKNNIRPLGQSLSPIIDALSRSARADFSDEDRFYEERIQRQDSPEYELLNLAIEEAR